jgi:hypothetical protein
MKSTCTIRRGQAAYTMVELMVAVLISVILMVAMYQIFARTQKIFTEGHHRGKMYEEGRALMDLIVRDLKQIAPSGLNKTEPWPPLPANHVQRVRNELGLIDEDKVGNKEWGFNKYTTYNDYWPTDHPFWSADPPTEPDAYHPFYGCNFMAWPYSRTELKVDANTQVGYNDGWTDVMQQGWDAAISETLISSRVEFFAQDVSKPTDEQWRVMGYRLYSQNNPVVPNKEIIGALWRYESRSGPVRDMNPILPSPLIEKVKNLRYDGDVLYQKISDNVIHFRMRAVSGDDPAQALGDALSFDGEDVPLYVEVELGIIEERLKKEILNDAEVERYDVLIEPLIAAIPNNPAADNLIEGRNVRIMKLLAENTDRILMLRQIVTFTSD